MFLAKGLLIVAGCGVATVATAQLPPRAPQSPPEQAAFDAGARAAKPTLTARYGKLALQHGDLRVPAGKGPHPVAVLMHGGCWMADIDKIGIAALADALTRRGIATWTIAYRRVGDAGGGWPGTFEDVSAGVDHLAKLARRHRLDMSRVTLVGHSSGAHLALWSASRPKLGAPWAAKVRPASVVAIDGPGTLAPFVGIDRQVCGRPVIVPLMGGTPAAKPAEYKIASPADHLPLGVRQLLVFGALGPMMQPYAAAARAAGDPVETLAPPKANHFDIVTPGTANGDAVVEFIAMEAFAGR